MQVAWRHDRQHDRTGVMLAVVRDLDTKVPRDRIEGPRPGIAPAAGTGDAQPDARVFSEDMREGEQFNPQ